MRLHMLTRTTLGIAALAFGSLCAQAAEYRTAPVTIDNTGHLTTVGGTVVPYKEVTLTAQIPGQVTMVAGRERDPTKAGQAIVATTVNSL